MTSQLSADRIAYAINVLRPDWGIVSLTTLIGELRRPLPDCAVALTVVALDEASTTPGRVRELGPWWNAANAAGEPQAATGAIPRTEPRCPRPGHEHELRDHCRICRSDGIARRTYGVVGHCYNIDDEWWHDPGTCLHRGEPCCGDENSEP